MTTIILILLIIATHGDMWEQPALTAFEFKYITILYYTT